MQRVIDLVLESAVLCYFLIVLSFSIFQAMNSFAVKLFIIIVSYHDGRQKTCLFSVTTDLCKIVLTFD